MELKKQSGEGALTLNPFFQVGSSLNKRMGGYSVVFQTVSACACEV